MARVEIIALLSFILAVCNTLVHAQDPIVKIVRTEPPVGRKPKLIIATRDSDVTMDCKVENLPQDTSVRWERLYTNANGQKQQEVISDNEHANDNTKHGIEKPTEFTWRLRIKRIQLTSAGKFRCYVTVIRQSKLSDSRYVEVMIVPTLDPAQTSTDMTAKEGDHVDLMCNATGKPFPMIEWRRQGGALLPIGKEVHRGAKLPIDSVSYKDRGVYQCKVYNILKTITRDIKLDVRFRPQLGVQRKEVYQAVGYQIELQCFVEANPFPSDENVKWVKGASTISTSSGRYTVNKVQGAFNRLTFELIISKVIQSDYGTYSCKVQNREGSSIISLKLIETEEPQKSIKLGRIISGSSQVNTCIITITLCAAAIFIQIW